MDRLIVQTKYGKWIKGSLTVYGDVNLLHGAFDKLFNYESTGLTPEQVAALQADRDAWRKRAEAAEKDITSLANGAYSICDMCALCGTSKDETKCPHGAYQDKTTGDGRSYQTYPDDPCDDFQYARDEGKEG